MKHELPQLPFEPEALAPWTSAETLSYHHGKHHAAYVSKLNAALEGHELAEAPLEEIISATRGSNPGVFNNAAQHYNHAMFWESLASESSAPEGALAEAIERDFGSLDGLKQEFSKQALGLFGSGWTWLVADADGKLSLRQCGNAECPVGTGERGLLPLDVWEHAYYIDHRNDRGAFVEGFWAHVDWSKVAERLAS